jgi:hypothetical protein
MNGFIMSMAEYVKILGCLRFGKCYIACKGILVGLHE